jgi:hypothetical protein
MQNITICQALAQAFAAEGVDTHFTDVSQFAPLFEAFQAQDKAEVWNIHVSDQVVAPQTRRTVSRGHGRCKDVEVMQLGLSEGEQFR